MSYSAPGGPSASSGQGGLGVLSKNSIVSGLVAGAIGGVLGTIAGSLVPDDLFLDLLVDSSSTLSDFERWQQIHTGIWVAVIGVFLGAVLAAWDSITSGAWERAARVGAIGAAAGGVAGFIGGVAAQALYSTMLRNVDRYDTGLDPKAMAARAIGWGLFGAILGLGLGLPLGGRKVVNGLLGGAVGGIAGGIMFEVVSTVLVENAEVSTASGAETLNTMVQLVGLVATGVGIGVAIGIADAVTKQAWLEFALGPLRGREVILFKDRTTLGSASSCDVVLANDPTMAPVHLAVVVGPGGVQIEPIGAVTVGGEAITTPRLIRAGEAVALGRSQFTISERRTG